MARTQHEKTINDDEGNPHTYVVTQHGGREGVRLLGRVLKVVSGPLGILAAVAGSSVAGQPSTTDDAEGAVDALDAASVAKALRESASALVAEGPDSLIEDILKHTFRDTEPVAKVFDKAYQGNYGELGEAVLFALTANFEATLKRVPFARASALLTRGSKG